MAEDHRHHRLRVHRYGRRGHPSRRYRLHPQAFHSGPDRPGRPQGLRDAIPRAEGRGPAGGSGARTSRGRFFEHKSPDEKGRRGGPSGGLIRSHYSPPRRERHGEDRPGPGHPWLEPSGVEGLSYGFLPILFVRASGERALRARQGAFTGAIRDNPGRIAASEGGTLFLDEISDLPLALQPKLLRFVQDKEYERVGDAVTRKADVRLLTATNIDLEAAVHANLFREDLFYRLNVIQIEIPLSASVRKISPDWPQSCWRSMPGKTIAHS